MPCSGRSSSRRRPLMPFVASAIRFRGEATQGVRIARGDGAACNGVLMTCTRGRSRACYVPLGTSTRLMAFCAVLVALETGCTAGGRADESAKVPSHCCLDLSWMNAGTSPRTVSAVARTLTTATTDGFSFLASKRRQGNPPELLQGRHRHDDPGASRRRPGLSGARRVHAPRPSDRRCSNALRARAGRALSTCSCARAIRPLYHGVSCWIRGALGPRSAHVC